MCRHLMLPCVLQLKQQQQQLRLQGSLLLDVGCGTSSIGVEMMDEGACEGVLLTDIWYVMRETFASCS